MGVYLRVDESRQPGENTLLYLPLESDLLDHSGKSVTVTNNGVSISSGAGYFNGNGYLSIPTADNILGNVFTISWYGKISARPIYSAIFSTMNSPYGGLTVHYEGTGLYAGTTVNNWDLVSGYVFTKNLDVWESYVLVRDNTNWSLYKNGTQIWSATSGSGNIIQNGSASLIGRNGGNYASNITGYISQFIIEDRARTSQEIADYYNHTKFNYGL